MKQRHYANTAATLSLGALVLLSGGGLSPVLAETGFSAAQERSDRQREVRGPSIREKATSEATESSLPGNRRVTGHIKDIRGDQMEIAIGNLQSLSVPLKMATDKGQTFNPGDEIVVTMNDHNAVVDYHHPNEVSKHEVVRGKLSTPLTVGLDKAVIETEQGTRTFLVAERAKGKLTAVPVGAEVLFLADETGRLVDAQLSSIEAVQQSAENNKARIKGAHTQMRALYQGTTGTDRMMIIDEGQEREVPFRAPLRKLERLQPGQEVVLLMDDAGYVMEVSTPDLMPTR
jgi:TusA-related sulfurtransferase